MVDKKYTKEEMEEEFRIKLLENNQSHMFKAIDRIDNNLTAMNGKIDTFKYWVLTLMIAQFGLILTFYFVK